MEITLNNNKEIIDGDLVTVEELLQLKNFTFKLIVTRINGRLVRKEERAEAVIRDGDDVTVLHLISGG
jgi:thiamine biosynthesis protein ThiS